MVLTLNIAPEKSRRLQDQARQAGLPLEEYARRVLEQTADTPPAREADEAPAQKAERFLRWAESHDRTKPVIPLTALDREHLYEERG